MNAKEEIIKELGNHKEGLIGILEKEIKLHKFQAHRYSSEDSYNKIQETKICSICI